MVTVESPPFVVKIRFRCEGDSVHARRVRDIADDLAGRAVHHHHMSSARNEHASGAGLGHYIISSALASDIVFLYREVLGACREWRSGESGCAKRGCRD